MNSIAPNPHPKELVNTPDFDGLSEEQELLATLAASNPHASSAVRTHAKSLLLINSGASVAQVAEKLVIRQHLVVALVHRFVKHGFCGAVLGAKATKANRLWLSLCPSSLPKVRLIGMARRKCSIDSLETSRHIQD